MFINSSRQSRLRRTLRSPTAPVGACGALRRATRAGAYGIRVGAPAPEAVKLHQ